MAAGCERAAERNGESIVRPGCSRLMAVAVLLQAREVEAPGPLVRLDRHDDTGERLPGIVGIAHGLDDGGRVAVVVQRDGEGVQAARAAGNGVGWRSGRREGRTCWARSELEVRVWVTAVAVGVSVHPATSVRTRSCTMASNVAPGWKGVAVAVALGSAVTRSGGAMPYEGAAGAQAAMRNRSARHTRADTWWKAIQ